MVYRILYEKLKNFISGNPAYRLVESGNTVELIYYPPTEDSASSTEDFERSSDVVIRIVGIRDGDYFVVKEAYVEYPDSKRPLDEESIEFWLSQVDLITQ